MLLAYFQLPSAFELCSDDPEPYCTRRSRQRWTKYVHHHWNISVEATWLGVVMYFTAPFGFWAMLRRPWALLYKKKQATMNKIRSSAMKYFGGGYRVWSCYVLYCSLRLPKHAPTPLTPATQTKNANDEQNPFILGIFRLCSGVTRGSSRSICFSHTSHSRISSATFPLTE